MKTLRLIWLAMRYHWDAQKSNPVNLAAAVVGMIVNNTIVLWGIWAMLFDGKPDSHQLTIYFLALNGMLTVSWGSVCVVLGGLHNLNTYIDEGSLEPMLATPRPALLLIGISNSLTAAIGDVIQGGVSLIVLFFIASIGEALRCVAFTCVGIVAVIGVFILTGSIPFFMKRGSNLALLAREISLSLSFYPTGKVFTGLGRYFLYLTPAAALGILPMQAVESGTWINAGISLIAAAAVFCISILVFSLGLKRYQTASYVMARG